MSALPSTALVSVEEYLAGEAVAEQRHEYVEGRVFAMAGGKVRHSRISSRAQLALGRRLGAGPCEIFDSGTKIRVKSSGRTRFYHPDAMVVCDSNPDDDLFQDRPVLIVEVLSPSTRRTDEGEKRDAYLSLGSLKVLLLVEPDEPLVSVDRRGADGAFTRGFVDGDDAVIPLPELGMDLPLRELYAG